MKYLIRTLVMLSISCCLYACTTQSNSETTSGTTKVSKIVVGDTTAGLGYEFEGNGKIKSTPKLNLTYTLSDLQLPQLDSVLKLNKSSIQNAKRARRKNKNKTNFENLSINGKQLERTLHLLREGYKPGSLEFHQLCGEDSLGNVHFTGYFSPVLQVAAEKDGIYQFPIYKKPDGPKSGYPTRKEIHSGALHGMGLELAYAKDNLAIYFMQVQGSGFVEYPDGKRTLFAYGGGNGHKYKSLGKYMVYNGYLTAEQVSLNAIRDYFQVNPDSVGAHLNYNPSYVFFAPRSGGVTGSSGTPLLAFESVAVDPKIIPYGSVLLGYVPVLNERGKLVKHEYRLLIAQDTGGAIRGPGHIDLYFGEGKVGEQLASNMHHYGKLWLILPDEKN